MNICKCGKEGLFQLKNGSWCCSRSHNSCPYNKNLNKNGNKAAYLEKHSHIYKKENRKCRFCGRTKETTLAGNGFHEKWCRNNPTVKSKLFVRRSCLFCGKEFDTSKRKGRKTCSKECLYKFVRSCYTEESRKKVQKTLQVKSRAKTVFIPNPKGFKKDGTKYIEEYANCPTCGQLFLQNRWGYRKTYCSAKCSYQNKDLNNKRSLIVATAYKNGKRVFGGLTKWIQYKNIKVQGTYEYRACVILDKLKDLDLIKHWEYTKDRYEYIGLDAKPHFYLLDFKVFLFDDSFYYLEVKGFKREVDDLKWDSVRLLGHRLDVWFKEDIEKKEVELNIQNKMVAVVRK